eukprot:TRINITY_DN1283_c0_g1_i1.p1 TRINITY_DN1283_c0_g1~~TRINITY_DN1283_c0_g1_i1.p1  ORF type:complete len:175 (-),score=13.41 TRINITY_DN1283_c0_g1_i1:35-559(-)
MSIQRIFVCVAVVTALVLSFASASASASYCDGCVTVVNLIEQKGCSEVGLICNKLASPYSAICNFIMNDGLCQVVVNFLNSGVNATRICSAIGLCGSGTCRCGVCTQYTPSRCLSLPNHCPSLSDNNDMLVAAKSEMASLSYSPKRATFDANNVEFCLDHQCASQYYGCCLTCF